MPTSNYNAKYDFSQFLAQYDVTRAADRLFNPGVVQQELDFLDQRIVELMYALPTESLYVAKQYESLTTIVYRHYGTTTPWWIVLMYNGLETSMQLQPGMQLKLPSLASINAVIGALRKPSGVGQVVTI